LRDNYLNKSDYRQDIDGLRAFAVLSVVFYHLDISFFSGGFVGVDIFFVISGYLITKHIYERSLTDGFTFRWFIYKRVRRLLPALLVVVLITLLLGIIFLSPSKLYSLSESSVAALVPVANIYYYQDSSYFDIGAEAKPLLHTWSLSVEEQFYLVWALFLTFMFKVRSKPAVIYLLLLFVFLSSFIAAGSVQSIDGDATFFLTPFRLYEFALGAIVFVFSLKVQVNHIVWKSLLYYLGLGIVIYSITNLSSSDSFPGYIAVIPAIGASLIILSGVNGQIRSILSVKLIVFIGVISYSVYLIHWPLIYYYELILFREEITTFDKGLIALLSLLMGFGMWKFVEVPFRSGGKVNTKHSIISIILTFLTIVFLSLTIILSKGLPDRFPKEYLLTKEDLKEERNRYWSKFGSNTNPILQGNKQDSILVIGNSHAIDLVYSLKRNGLNAHIDFVGTTCSGLINPNAFLGGKLHPKEVFNEKTKTIFHNRI
jgi:peptidoglycan/LPS O-acetylase OafA/YrhL